MILGLLVVKGRHQGNMRFKNNVTRKLYTEELKQLINMPVSLLEPQMDTNETRQTNTLLPILTLFI